MRPRRIRFTVRTMMIVIATLGVTWSAFSGVGHMTIYGANRRAERYYREGSRIWAIKKDVRHAREYMHDADKLARMNQQSLNAIVTALSLAGLGGVLVCMKLALAAPCVRSKLGRSRVGTYLGDACSTGAWILLVGFALACVAYAAVMLVVAIWHE